MTDADRRAKLEILALTGRQIAAAQMVQERLRVELSGQPCGCDSAAGHVCTQHAAESVGLVVFRTSLPPSRGRLTTAEIIASLTGKKD